MQPRIIARQLGIVVGALCLTICFVLTVAVAGGYGSHDYVKSVAIEALDKRANKTTVTVVRVMRQGHDPNAPETAWDRQWQRNLLRHQMKDGLVERPPVRE